MKNKIRNRSYYQIFLSVIFSTCCIIHSRSQILNDFIETGSFNEQELWIKNEPKDVTICINAPLHFNKKGETYLDLFALPNGNSIEWAKGKKMKAGDDWHFDIQHIAAQTRFIRNIDKKNNYIIAYLMAGQKSWPTWKKTTANSLSLIKNIVDTLENRFKDYHPRIILNGHSGGGSFIFGYIDVVEKTPEHIERIAFLDSDYGYEDSLHTKKLVDWLQNKNHSLIVLAYNDSLVIYNGKPLVSSTGGTLYRSRLMQRRLSENFAFKTVADSSFINHAALNGRIRMRRIRMILKENPNGLIYHTVQVEKNGFIFSMLSSARYDKRKHFTYFGDRVYEKLIQD